MINMTIRHSVADFDTWKAGYDAHESGRTEHGCRRAVVGKVAGSNNDLLVVLSFDDLGSAESFASDPALKDAMADAGVQGPPEITFSEQIETVDYAGASA